MRRPAFARTPENGSRIERSKQPEQSVDQINPDGVLHAPDAVLLGGGVGFDVDLAENAEERDPEDAGTSLSVAVQASSRFEEHLQKHPVPEERPVGLEEGDAIDEHRDGRQTGDDFSIHPLAVGVGASVLSVVEVDAIQTGDGDGQHKLEKSKNESDQCAEDAAAAGAITEKVESTHVESGVCCQMSPRESCACWFFAVTGVK